MLKNSHKILIFDFPHPSSRFAANPILRIHIRTFLDKQFGDFLTHSTATKFSRNMQRSPAKRIIRLRIHIRTSSDVLFNCFDVPINDSLVKQFIR